VDHQTCAREWRLGGADRLLSDGKGVCVCVKVRVGDWIGNISQGIETSVKH